VPFSISSRELYRRLDRRGNRACVPRWAPPAKTRRAAQSLGTLNRLVRSAKMGTVTSLPMQSQMTAPQRETILVVEDDVLIRMAAASELRGHGFVVVEAYSAEEAVALLQAQLPVRLVFTDVQLPGAMDGLALAAVAKTYPGVKIVITSGHGNIETRAAEVADAFLRKPYFLERVTSCIERLISDDVT
jgi:CheY-like chemotaxis protein